MEKYTVIQFAANGTVMNRHAPVDAHGEVHAAIDEKYPNAKFVMVYAWPAPAVPAKADKVSSRKLPRLFKEYKEYPREGMTIEFGLGGVKAAHYWRQGRMSGMPKALGLL